MCDHHGSEPESYHPKLKKRVEQISVLLKKIITLNIKISIGVFGSDFGEGIGDVNDKWGAIIF